VYADIPRCPNLAYLVGEGELFHPGDSFVLPPGPVTVLAVPIDGPWLKLSDAVDHVIAVSPQVAVPIHEGELTDPAKYAGMLATFTGDAATVRTLAPGCRRACPEVALPGGPSAGCSAARHIGSRCWRTRDLVR